SAGPAASSRGAAGGIMASDQVGGAGAGAPASQLLERRGLPTLTLGRPSSSFFTYIKSRSSLLTPPLFTGSTLAGGDSEQGHGHGHGHEQGYSIVRVHSAGQQITVNTSAAHRSTSVLIVPVDVQPPHQQQQQLEEGTLAGQDASPAKRRACAPDDVEAQAGERGV
ncbi:hypothetical protein EVG20_g1818, partial [Dentipellis fragilis]